jgi:hypothetical protein
MWSKLTSTETERRQIRPLPTNGIMHTEAADVGFGRTLDVAGNPGDPGQWQYQGTWEWKDRSVLFRSENSRQFVWCSGGHWENA